MIARHYPPSAIVALVLFVFCLSPSPILALDIEDEMEPSQFNETSLIGLIMNQTTSPPGYEFYRIFTSYWYPPETKEEYNIFITDRVHPHLGTWLFVQVNDQVVHRVRVNTRKWEIEQVAKIAVGTIERYVIKRFANPVLTDYNGDLVGDGL